MGDDDRNGGKARRDSGKRKRIAEPKIEGRWKAEFFSHADGQDTTVHEHCGLVLGRCGKDLSYSFIVQSVAVHCRKQADSAEALFAKRTRETVRNVASRGIEHEEADEACWVTGDGGRNGCFIAGDACDDRGA